MTRNNDLFYKILFAIEIALLPMVIFAHMFIADWAMGLFIAGILACKVWREIFKDKRSKSQHIISIIASILVFSVLLIFFMCIGLVNIALGVATVVLVVLMNLMSLATYGKNISDTISAVDFCYLVFECLTLLAFSFLSVYEIITNIGLFAIIMTAVVSVVYKVYFIFKYTDFMSTLKSKFRRK